VRADGLGGDHARQAEQHSQRHDRDAPHRSISTAVEAEPSTIRDERGAHTNAWWDRPWGAEEKSAPVKARIPPHRLGTALEIADLALFLASPASDFICGQVVFIDGGYSAV
jgi:NAD(P)-dependent dehydrogenase (short-subunit alcohol dehydrogenase family)